MKKFFVILLIFSFTNSLNSISQTSIDEHGLTRIQFQHLLSDGNIALMKQDKEKALSCFQQALRLNNKSSICNFQIARMYYKDGDMDAALHYATAAQNLSPQNRWYNHLLACIYEQTGDYGNALKYYDTFLTLGSSNLNDYLDLANFQIRYLKFDDAILTYNRIEKMFGYQEEICYRRAQIYERKRNIKAAAEEYKRVISIDSTNLYAYGMLEELYYNNNQLAEAQSVQNQILKIDPKNPVTQLSQAMLCRASGNVECFYQNLNESFDSDKLSVKDKLMIIQDIETSPIFSSKRVKQLFETLTKRHPESSQVYIKYADYYMYHNDFENALQQLLKSVKYDKSNFDIYRNIFNLYVLSEKYEELKVFSDDVFELYPDMSEVIMYSAVADTYLGNYESAADNFAVAQDLGIEFSKSKSLYLFYFGAFNYLSGNKDVAFDYLDKYYRSQRSYLLTLRLIYYLIDSKKDLNLANRLLSDYKDFDYNWYYYYHYVKSYYYYAKGDYKLANDYINKSLKLSADKDKVNDLAGDIAYKTGDCKSALNYWNLAIKYGGNSTLINKKIKNCKN